MPDDRMVKRVYECIPMPTRPLERPKNRREDEVKNYVKHMRLNNWKDCIRNRTK
jgi:hypothetical protein